MIKIIYFCHSVNRFFGQRISGIDSAGRRTTHDERLRAQGAEQLKVIGNQ